MSLKRKISNLITYISFWYEAVRNPELYDYLNMGRGIEHRRIAYQKQWDEHFERCAEFQNDALGGIYYESLAVLGAGNLFDLSHTILNSHKEIICYDIDPIAANRTKKKYPNIAYHIQDVTGVLTTWRRGLRTTLSRNPTKAALIDFLRGILQTQSKFTLATTEVVLSLNILGQIPLYWKDFVFQSASKVGINAEEDVEILKALTESCEKLQSLHLSSLTRGKPKCVIIITDKSFIYYTATGTPTIEPALHLPTPLKLPGYALNQEKTWEWEVVPLAAGATEWGERHDIIACSYVKE